MAATFTHGYYATLFTWVKHGQKEGVFVAAGGVSTAMLFDQTRFW